MHLSIIIPAYNEQERLAATLSRIGSYCDGKSYDYEVIVVNDGSVDNTREVALKSPLQKTGRLSVLTNKQNQGKGYSIKKGITESRGDYVLFSDADLSTPIEEVERLFAAIDEGYDIAIGSRSIKGALIKVRQPFYREYMGRFFNKLVQGIVFQGIVDTQCGFKLFKGSIAGDIAARMRIDGFAFDVEMLYLARISGYRIKEVPIVWENSPLSRVSPVTDSFKMLFDILLIKKLHERTEYRK